MSPPHESLPAPLRDAVDRRLAAWRDEQVPARLWSKDASLWTADPERLARVRQRLGWLHAHETMRAQCLRLSGFAQEVRRLGVRDVLLLGMGGSSLAPRVFSQALEPVEGWPRLRVLDTTHPEDVLAAGEAVDLERTLVIVSSKSGTTAETLALHAHFAELVPDGRRFVAITDAGRLVTIAAERGFRRTFLNAPDIGGRYSALSYFGLVPAALLGLDVTRLLESADRMARTCGPDVAPHDSPAARLGAVMAEAALAGRDKLTLVLDPPLASLGAWIEQLVAESSGKDGRGIVPVAGETLADPSAYGSDRLFVHVGLDGGVDRAGELGALAEAGHPVVRLSLQSRHDLGGEMLRWEIATALACRGLGVDPFDEPDVQASKDETSRLLARAQQAGRLPDAPPVVERGGLRMQCDATLAEGLRAADRPGPADLLAAHYRRARPGDYAAVLAFLPERPEVEQGLAALRGLLRERMGAATLVGMGPRYLHSTGQLLAGGSDAGILLLVTAATAAHVPIPGQPHDFGTLLGAQALGSFKMLQARGRRIVRCHLQAGADALPGLIEAAGSAMDPGPDYS